MKLLEFEFVDLLDGRFALKRDGLVIFVGRSEEEIKEKFRQIASNRPDNDYFRNIKLVKAVRKIK